MFFVFSNEIADCYLIWLATLPKKDCKYLWRFLSKNFQNFFKRKFGIVDKGNWVGCARSRVWIQSAKKFQGFQTEQKAKSPLFSRAHKSLNSDISAIFFLPNFITIWYLKIQHNSKLIDFYVKYPRQEYAGYTVVYCNDKHCVRDFLHKIAKFLLLAHYIH